MITSLVWISITLATIFEGSIPGLFYYLVPDNFFFRSELTNSRRHACTDHFQKTQIVQSQLSRSSSLCILLLLLVSLKVFSPSSSFLLPSGIGLSKITALLTCAHRECVCCNMPTTKNEKQQCVCVCECARRTIQL